MNLPNETMCILPWTSIEASPIGTLRPCCMADTELVDDNGVKYEASTAKLDDVRNSDQMYDLRSDFLEGKKPKMCRRCWAEEDSGRTSKRQNTIKRLEHMINDTEAWTPYAKELMFLDLKLGNICNLKCRICGPWSSSSIASEEVMLLDKDKRKGTYPHTMLQKGAWPRKSETFWEELYNNSSNITYLEFTGGEPFMIKEHFEYLEYLVNAGLAGNIEIHYNTNGTQWPEDHLHLWEKFKHVEIAVSIDNLGKRFEYERSGASWFDVTTNMGKLFELRKNSSNISLQLCVTVNVFNVLYIDEIAKHVKPYDFVFWNLLHDAPEWCITSLPDNVKTAVETKLLGNESLPDNIRNEFKSIIKFMKSPPTVTLYELMMKIKELDFRRNERLEYHHPELWKLLVEATFVPAKK